MRCLLALLPAVAYAGAVVATYPSKGQVTAPFRLALIRAAVLVGAFAVVGVEVLSRYQALELRGFVWLWGVGGVLAGVAAWARRRTFRRPELPRLDRATTLACAGLGAVYLGALVLALTYPPNNFDSMTYHLPRIEHWVQQHSVEVFAVRIHRQVTYPPGAEYLMLHLRVLTGGDRLHNLVQWGAAVGCAVAASRIAAQLGGARLAQVLAAVVVGSAPLVALEASSTQNDLVTALWVAAIVTVALDRGRDLATVVPLGLATGLVAVTKMTGLFGAAPVLLVWGIVAVRRVPVRAVLAGVGVLALAGVLVGPFLARTYAEFGNVLGPAYLSDSVTMGKHTPGAIGINALKVVQSLFDNPLTVGFAQGILTLARWFGVDPHDPATNFGPAFPQITWYPDEDRSSYPLQALLVLAGVVAALVRRAPARIYACCFLAAALLHVSMIKWQMWGNRLTAYLLVLGAPLAGLLLAALWRRRAVLAAPVVAFALLLGLASVGYGWPRRLVGANSLLTLDEGQRRFARRPLWQADFEWAAERVGGARVIGIAEDNDSWEYPWWFLLPGRDMRALQSLVDSRPATPAGETDAVVCTIVPVDKCGFYRPEGWSYETHGTVTVILPPVR
ncbi:hypothetical protein Lfu02_24480 [Longispora fulva]|uniref:Dolichyl-phosphate-mannose-protein mannosyltransferase n=1 Tax=Longispora fulva TaxID=619741 RepID=A0A8J7GJY5_9ACTN|nr:hypothetical protein [Longispora fulva]MBG6139541.1 hypothetical protein [Longispora fulva]GIG58076.1 hypothetical protein Lfu02_24480 [Longispora fulva]